jgi:hypothetical protein
VPPAVFVRPLIAMVAELTQHAAQWWNELGESGRLALTAVAAGACVVIATTWMGVRTWWQRWKQERTDWP